MWGLPRELSTTALDASIPKYHYGYHKQSHL